MPHSAATTRPPTSRLCTPSRSAATDGPSDMYRPPSDQLAMSAGPIVSASPRSRAGRPTRGRSEARAPGRRVDVSGDSATATAEPASMTSSTTKTSVVGAGASWMSSPQPSAPKARPPSAATPLTTPPRLWSCGGLQVDEHGAERREGRAGREPLHDAGEGEHLDVAGDEEQDDRDRLADDRGAEHRPAADVVRQRADDEQRGEQGERVDREDLGQRARREAPLLLVDRVQRRRHGGGGGERDGDGGHRPEGAVVREAAGGGGCDGHERSDRAGREH